ncbi:hypothetical protein [Nostoc sp.]|uniref:hypothetical protein n=1 Tax=Nostoc sp. TaxID=1180 RepID=UPI002FFA16F3
MEVRAQNSEVRVQNSEVHARNLDRISNLPSDVYTDYAYASHYTFKLRTTTGDDYDRRSCGTHHLHLCSSAPLPPCFPSPYCLGHTLTASGWLIK